MTNRYQVKGKIGQGGLGDVYLAHDTQLDREVALKRVRPPEDSAISAANLEADLIREARTLSSLQHPNIVTIYDVGRNESGSFVVMELLKGETLDQVSDRGKLTVADFREVVLQVLEGMVAAQSLGLVHRDLKPGNLMVNWLASGKFQIKILDFGLARFSKSAVPQTQDQGDGIFGSIWFMAPEQFERRPLDARTDMYSLGCIFYKILTQRHPFDGTSPVDVMVSHLQHSVTPLQDLRSDVPRWMADWVMWLVSRNMDDRPHDARTALNFFLAEASGLPAEPAPPPPPPPKAASVRIVGRGTAPGQRHPSQPARSPAAVTRPTATPAAPVAAKPAASKPATRPVAAASPPTTTAAPRATSSKPSRPTTPKDPKAALKWWILAGVALIAYLTWVILKPRTPILPRADHDELVTRLATQDEPQGDATLVAELVSWIGETASPETPKIAAVLGRLKGPDINEAIGTQLATAKGAARTVLTEIAGDRPSPAGNAALLEILASGSPEDRNLAADALGKSGNAPEALAMVKAAAIAKDDQSRRNIANGVSAILARSADPATRVRTIAPLLPSCDPAFRPDLLRLLAATGDASASDVLIDEIKAGGDRLRDAFNQLDAWPAADANLASAVLAATLTGDHDSLTGPAARLLARLQDLDAPAAAASLARLVPATASSPKAATDFCLAAASLASPEAAALVASIPSDAAAPAQAAIADNIKRITTIQSGPNVLPAAAAVIVSNTKDAFHSPTVRYISGWLQPSTRLAWDITIPKAGKFSVSILQSSGQKGDRSCRIALGTSATERNVRVTGANEQFEAIDAGSFTIPKPGTWRLWIEPLRSTPGQPLMNIREITITAP